MSLIARIKRHLVGPRVSVIVPVFNGSAYLAAALDSLLAQTYRNVEIIVVNDGSNDDGATARVIRRYRIRHPSIRCINKPNGGVASALNAGIQAMTGDYFCWLSHDDTFKPNKIERQIQVDKETGRQNVAFYSDYELIDATGAVTGRAYMAPVLGDRPSIARFRGAINGCTILVPRHAFHVAGRFDESLRYTQDYDLWDRLSDHFDFVHIPEALIQTRLHAEQGSRDSAATAAGDALWIAMAKRTTVKSRGTMSGSSFAFFRDLADFLEATPYQRAVEEIRQMAAEVATPLVCVVIPILNELHLAERAIHSVLDQTYTNVEVIAVLDAAADGDDLDRFRDDPRVRFFRDRGGSSSSARNLGVLVSRGEYVAFLDHDDLFEINKIERQVSTMITSRCLVSHTSYYVTYPERRSGRAVMGSGKLTGSVFPEIMCNCPIALPTAMMHRSVFEDGIKFGGGHLGIDCLMWVDIARKYDIVGIDEPLSTVEWSDQSAAIHLPKLLAGMTAMRDAYLAHPFYRQFTAQIETISRAIDDIGSPVDGDINHALIDAAFGGLLTKTDIAPAKTSAEKLSSWTIKRASASVHVPSPTAGFTDREIPAWFVQRDGTRVAGPFFECSQAENFIIVHAVT